MKYGTEYKNIKWNTVKQIEFSKIQVGEQHFENQHFIIFLPSCSFNILLKKLTFQNSIFMLDKMCGFSLLYETTDS